MKLLKAIALTATAIFLLCLLWVLDRLGVFDDESEPLE